VAVTREIILAAALVAVAAIVVVFFVATRRARRRVQRAQDPYVEGLALLVDGERAEAFARFQESVRGDSAPADAYIRLGNLLRERGEAGKALQIHKSLTVKTDLGRREKTALFVDIAEDYAALGHGAKAIEVLDTAVRTMHLRSPRVYRVLAREAHRLGRTEDAYGYLKELARAGGGGDRELALYLASAGEDLVAAGKAREARKALQRALRYDGQCATAHLAMGNLEEREGRLDAAVERWRRAAALSDALSPFALERIAAVMFQGGTFGEIEAVYQEVLAERADDERATMALASFYRKQGRDDEAIQLLEDYRSGHPDAEGARAVLASLYASRGGGGALQQLLAEQERSLMAARAYQCGECGRRASLMRWHCPSCNAFDTFQKSDA
jgi:lipopolysaccharide biosynthesis regulator YciM